MLSGRRLTILRVAGAASIVGLSLYAAQTLWQVGGSAATPFFETWVYPSLLFAAGALCVARVVAVKSERAAWLAFGVGLLAWFAGEAVYSLALDGPVEPAHPNASDLLWLAFYPAAYAGLLLLLRERVREFRKSLWLDGAVGALAVGALATALVLGPGGVGPDSGLLAADLVFVFADVLLLGFVVAGFALTAWRPGRAFALIGVALAAGAVADGYFFWAGAANAELATTIMATLWPTSALLVSLAAWQKPTRRTVRMEGWRILAMPALFGLVAVGLLAAHTIVPINVLARVLALGTLIGVIARMALTFQENLGQLEGNRREASTDSLTGLGNRRRLMDDLARAIGAATLHRPAGLVMFDLDGFKLYNDRFGHPLGDAVLAQLGEVLALTVGDAGTAYRLGGDEFCVVATDSPEELRDLALRAQAALSERGDGFDVGCSYGIVLIPQDARDATHALKVVDDRLYANKGDSRRSTATRQTSDALLQVLRECQPSLNGQVDEVALLARGLGLHLGLRPPDMDELSRAAALHDIGKVSVPSDILGKEGPLDESEWRFMRQHTLAGDRILSAAPALGPVARLVRASHERFDGRGYPDGLAGEAIPYAARIVAVCDAYHAMTADRPYSVTREPAEAIEELRHCAGSQFDPHVVEAFVELLEEGVRPFIQA